MKDNQSNNRWIAFVSIPAQMAGIIYFFYWLGKKADEYWNLPNELGVKILGLLGVFISMFQVINEVKKLSKNE